MKHTVVAAIAVLSWSSVADANVSIQGLWTAEDGSATARIESCADDRSRLCAVVVADRPEPGEPSQVGQIAISGLQPDGRSRWRGRYHDGDQRLPVTLRLQGENRISMRVCVGLYCASETYVRGAP